MCVCVCVCLYVCVCVFIMYYIYIQTKHVWVYALSCSSFISSGVMCCILSLVFWSCFRPYLTSSFVMLGALCETCAEIVRRTIADSMNSFFLPTEIEENREYFRIRGNSANCYTATFNGIY